MITRLWIPSLVLGVPLVLAIGCSSSGSGSGGGTTTPSPTSTQTNTTFNVPLSAGSEVPAISNGEAGVGGTATITLHATKDGSGAVTSATVDFQFTATGFPVGSTVTMAHIHSGAAGVIGNILVDAGLTSGSVGMSGGSASFQKNGVNVPADVAQGMLNSPAGYYFNVHSSLNPDGVARGQLDGSGGGGGGGGTPPPPAY